MIIQWLLASYGAKTYATWNPSDKGTSITLSNWNKTVVNTTASWNMVRSTIWKSSWKWYWEVTANSSTAMIMGIANSSWNLLSYVGSDINGWGWSEISMKYNNWSWTAYGANYTTNDVIWIALDMNAGTLIFYKNNTSQWTAFTGLTGTIYAAVGSINSSQTTTNFWSTALTYSPPAWYNAWLYN